MPRGGRVLFWGAPALMLGLVSLVLGGCMVLRNVIPLKTRPKGDEAKGFIALDNASLFFSPWNWYRHGGTAQTTHLGAWLKFGWTGGSLRLEVDVSPLDRVAAPPEAYPQIGYSIDGGPVRTVSLTRGTRELTLATNLPAGRHRCQAYLRSIGFGKERWRAGRQVELWRVTGVRLDPGSAIEPDPTLRPRRALFFGDSILGASFNLGGETDSLQAWPEVVVARLDAEPGRVGFEGQSYSIPGNASNGNVPALFIPRNPRESTWDLLDSVHPRLADGQLSPRPDFVFLCHGANDAINRVPDDQVQASVQGLLPYLRNASGAKARIYVVVPFEGFCRDPITAAFRAYQAATPDRGCHLIDLGTEASVRVKNTRNDPLPSRSFDGLHPNSAMHARLGKMISERVLETLSQD